MAPIAVRIGLTPLEESLLEEHRQLLAHFEHSDEEGRPVVMDPNELSVLLTVDVMCDKLHLKRRREKREYAVGQKILFVYNGFMSAYKLLMDAVAGDDADMRAQLADENQLRDALAGRSALIASDEESSTVSQWFVMDMSDGGVHIKTRESQFTTSLFIGQLVAYSFTREELQEPAVRFAVMRFMALLTAFCRSPPWATSAAWRAMPRATWRSPCAPWPKGPRPPRCRAAFYRRTTWPCRASSPCRTAGPGAWSCTRVIAWPTGRP